MEKITIIGAGNVGAHAAISAAILELGNIVLLDQDADLAKGKALDITQSMALAGTVKLSGSCPVSGF
ncbi:MAG: hypothetical protein QNL05_11975 [Gammaproteobacteria bacterium]|nr:hypothetical protein [Gammaproteobacteria bacterium]